MAEASPSGFAIRRNNSCLLDEVDCGSTAPPYRACCPSGSSCPTQYNVDCCPSSANCTQQLVRHPNCANRTWTLYDNSGYFCCESGLVGYDVANSDGCGGAGAMLPSGARLLKAVKEGQTFSSASTSGSTASRFSSTSPSGRISPSSTSQTQPTASSSDSASGHSNAGAIAGGVVGGVLAIALICGAIWFWKRRRRSNAPIVENQAGTDTRVPEKDGRSVNIVGKSRLEKDGRPYVTGGDGLGRHELPGREPAGATELP